MSEKFAAGLVRGIENTRSAAYSEGYRKGVEDAAKICDEAGERYNRNGQIECSGAAFINADAIRALTTKEGK